MIKNQFPIDLAASQGRVIGSNESFEKSHEKNYETDNSWWEIIEKKKNGKKIWKYNSKTNVMQKNILRYVEPSRPAGKKLYFFWPATPECLPSIVY